MLKSEFRGVWLVRVEREAACVVKDCKLGVTYELDFGDRTTMLKSGFNLRVELFFSMNIAEILDFYWRQSKSVCVGALELGFIP